MQVLHLSYSDSGAGGFRAAYRTHRALIASGIDSRMLVVHKKSQNVCEITVVPTVERVLGTIKRKFTSAITRYIGRETMHISPAIFPSTIVSKINRSRYDIVHIHWVQHEMLSVKDIACITKPKVMTLHDMWAFTGAEHISFDSRWREGYIRTQAVEGGWLRHGTDLNRWTWARKKRLWKQPFQLIAPSSWMYECARNSDLMKGWPIQVVPNPLDTQFWKPSDGLLMRNVFKTQNDERTILFCSSGIASDYYKGADLLREALQLIRNNRYNVKLIVFGIHMPEDFAALHIPCEYIGRIDNDRSLRALYSAADILVVPSRIESFGQVASEAQACGTPVVAFNSTGVADIVGHLNTGYLARYCDSSDFAHGIEYILSLTPADYRMMRMSSRIHCVNSFRGERVARDLTVLYRKVIETSVH